MKFISKFSNYRIVLRPGLPGNRATGTQPVPGLYVKFEGGIAEINNEESIELVKQHPAFLNGDIVMGQEDGVDVFAATRKEPEPVHNVVDVEYGHVGKNINPAPPTKLNADQAKALKSMAAELATNMLKEMLPKAVEQAIAERTGGANIIEETVPEPMPEVKDPRFSAPEPIEDTSGSPDDSVGDVPPLNIVKEEAKIGGEEIGKVEDVEVVAKEETTPTEEPDEVVEAMPKVDEEPAKKKAGRPRLNK